MTDAERTLQWRLMRELMGLGIIPKDLSLPDQVRLNPKLAQLVEAMRPHFRALEAEAHKGQAVHPALTAPHVQLPIERMVFTTTPQYRYVAKDGYPNPASVPVEELDPAYVQLVMVGTKYTGELRWVLGIDQAVPGQRYESVDFPGVFTCTGVDSIPEGTATHWTWEYQHDGPLDEGTPAPASLSRAAKAARLHPIR